MSQSFAEATSQPRSVVLDGRPFLVGKLSPRDFGQIEAWMREADENPYITARKAVEGMPDSLAKHAWEHVLASALPWPPRIGNARGDAILGTLEGTVQVLFVCLKKFNPNFTIDDAWILVDRVEAKLIGETISLAMPGDPSAPKSPDGIETQQAE